ncbi:hypothetical protein NAPIS_ORF02744 [Vairimorpha apis BRL 01]|uniref:Kinetochore protein SPC25 n=1 Tax=Vairimorpha apis BRL 01 TaxID=1037528 RepID=T0M8H5_9MICR|nr:hypothetical protein NAPIS_ORF02744 [Vairimorpha apis BRL 01]
MEEFETIEHDMVHIKDYFRNYKFGMQERLSKLYFLQNLNTTKINDSNDLLKTKIDDLDLKIEQHNKELETKQTQSLLLNTFINAKQKYDQVYEEIQKTLNINKEYNVEELEKHRNKLQTRTRRLSVIQYEKYIEDLFDFYSNFNLELTKIFGCNISSTISSDNILIECKKLDKIIKIEINNGKIVNIKGINDECLVKYFIKVNNPRFVVYFAMNN